MHLFKLLLDSPLMLKSNEIANKKHFRFFDSYFFAFKNCCPDLFVSTFMGNCLITFFFFFKSCVFGVHLNLQVAVLDDRVLKSVPDYLFGTCSHRFVKDCWVYGSTHELHASVCEMVQIVE